MILFSDLHLRPESEEVCFRVLDAVAALAESTGDRDVTCLGDWWHVRYAIPVTLLNRVHRMLVDWVLRGFRVRILPGNHDQVDVHGQHALEVFRDVPGVQVFTEPTHEPGVGTWLPYRKDPRALIDWVRVNQAGRDLPAFLHHGIVGAYMNDHRVAGDADGLPPAALPFPVVFCGHWHRHQQVAQCVYVGSQWQTKADEAGQVKGVVRVFAGGQWQFLPLDVGRRHHRLERFTPDEVARVRPGDAVRLPSGVPAPELATLVAALRTLGADVTVDGEEPAAPTARLGAALHAPLREQAAAYVQTQALPDGVSATDLMTVFDELRGSGAT